MLSAPRPATREEVPVLDLAPLNEGRPLDELARQLRRACETIGFFYVANHGVPKKVVDEVFAVTRRYFDLPFEKRMELRIDERFRRGFMPQGINQHPGYAPDLSPWDQGGWHHLKHVEMRNLSCMDLDELHLELHLAIGRLRQKPHLIHSFFAAAGLEL